MKKIRLCLLFFLSFLAFKSYPIAAVSVNGTNNCTYTTYKELLECNADKKSCISEMVTGFCSNKCSLENLNNKDCLLCIVANCGTQGIYGNGDAQSSVPSVENSFSNGINNVTSNNQTPVIDPNFPSNIPQTQDNLCDPTNGINCSQCSTEHGTCVRNCIINEAYPTTGQCYNDCYFDGKGYYLDSKSCNQCLNRVCDRDIRDDDNLLEPSLIDQMKDDSNENTGEWNFCDKHGVLVSMKILNRAFVIAKIIVPIFLIIFGIIDLIKAVTSSDSNAINNATGSLIKKVIIGLLVFFIPTIINAVFGLIDDHTKFENNGCYTCFFNRDGCNELIENSNDK